MNDDEKCAEQYLIEHGFTSVIFEPDGNIPPDFLVDQQIAVEVRRLNQHYHGVGDRRGLEEDSIPLEDAINSILPEFDSYYSGSSFFVSLKLRRPLPKIKEIKDVVRQTLTEFLLAPSDKPIELLKSRNLSIKIFMGHPIANRVFLLAGNIDLDDGGFLIPEMVENIRICIDEKATKIASHHIKYSRWWLALIDHIGFGIQGQDQLVVRQQISINPIWERVVVISAADTRHAFELTPHVL